MERDLDLIRELERVAEQRGVSLSVVASDLAAPGELRLPVRPALAIGPLHVIQVLDAPARPALLARLRELMAPRGHPRPHRRRRDRRSSAPGRPPPRSSPTCASSRAGSTRASRSGSRSGTVPSPYAGCARASPPRAGWSVTSTTRSSTGWTPRPSSARRPTLDSVPPDRRQIRSGRERGRLDGRAAGGPGMTDTAELRLLALYPEQMNIYADRGNMIFLQRRCEWRGIPFRYAAAGPGDGFDPARARPDLHRRRPGPRSGAGRRGHAPHQARRDRLRRRGRRRSARRLRRLPAARPSLPAGRGVHPGARHRRPRDGARARPAPDRQRLDRGRPGRWAARAGRIREPRRAHAPRPGRRAPRAGCCTATGTTTGTATRASSAST